MKTAQRVYRHPLLVRLTHWLNVLFVPVLIMSGLQIFNAHRFLYWGNRSDLAHLIVALPAFPEWSTLPGPKWLAMGRRWHLFFAWLFLLNGLVFAVFAVCSRHLTGDLMPRPAEIRKIKRTIVDHLRFRHPRGESAKHYNVLQKITYLLVLYALAPLLILTGLAMSPTIDAAFPPLLHILGGRQTARTLHFVSCFAMVAFIVGHLFMVAVTGFRNNMRSILSGWYHLHGK